MIKKLFFIFLLAFVANWLWENIHSFLYVHYEGGAITQLILTRAALVDAVIITVMGAFFFWIRFLHKRPWLLFVLGVLVAIGIEWWAFGTGRWAYNDFMPIIPVLGTGITPTIQLGFLSYGIFTMIDTKSSRRTGRVSRSLI